MCRFLFKGTLKRRITLALLVNYPSRTPKRAIKRAGAVPAPARCDVTDFDGVGSGPFNFLSVNISLCLKEVKAKHSKF